MNVTKVEKQYHEDRKLNSDQKGKDFLESGDTRPDPDWTIASSRSNPG